MKSRRCLHHNHEDVVKFIKTLPAYLEVTETEEEDATDRQDHVRGWQEELQEES